MQWFIRPRFWLGSLFAVATILTSLFVIETAYQTRQLYSALQETRAEQGRLTIEWGRLLLERGALAADLRIDAMARSSMDLSSPKPGQILMMERPE